MSKGASNSQGPATVTKNNWELATVLRDRTDTWKLQGVFQAA